MPKRHDIHSLLILGAGPIVIGQACEFDYSGTQACKALREEGYRVILVNSNPATIMTDPDMADATYIEPIIWQEVEKIIEQERPDALLATMGGQTALNCALQLQQQGVLQRYNVELIGANADTIDKAEDRARFDQAMRAIGLETPRSGIAHSLTEAWSIQQQLGFPCIIRPSFTMGGSGGGIAYNKEEFVEICERGLELSPTHELLIDESLIGWKEYEMEVVRDRKDNCIIVCAIENLDPLGIHTGDSITVAPAQTLTDKDYQRMRAASIAVLREIGVETGGSNVQFGINPADGRMVVIEMNPRVSRSSALASKATGFPIAKVAAKLAVGYTLDELRNEITGDQIPAAFEPSLDYVVTKLPRFAFEKFPQANDRLTTQMKSVGEVMAMGRNFQESLQKALRGLEVGACGLDPKIDLADPRAEERLKRELAEAGAERIWYVADAFRLGKSMHWVHELTAIDPWFLVQIEQLVSLEQQIAQNELSQCSAQQLRQWKRKGFSDQRLAQLLLVTEQRVREYRWQQGVRPVYKRVDTCAGEFPTRTAYLYSCYDDHCEAAPTDRQKVMIIGGGPNRIGQGIEFDYCCVHAAWAMRDKGYETLMVNCNPETVSTDYDTSDRLYFEPVTLEDVLEIIAIEQPVGVIVQFGGQTPLKLARALQQAGVPILGTSPDAIDQAEDRERFQRLITELGLMQPENATVRSVEQALHSAQCIGYPLVVRPSYVLGGRAMEIVYNDAELMRYMSDAVQVSNEAPVLLDRFLSQAIEIDVDAVCDGQQVVIGAIMQHIEEAGIHSGDSACVLPPYSLSTELQQRIREQVTQMALALKVKGLMNVQMAWQQDQLYVIEVNPRASRTVPFVSKATGLFLANIAARVMAGETLQQIGCTHTPIPQYFAVKESVLPFAKFPTVDPILSPEMKSTGEVMGVGDSFAQAYGKAVLASGAVIPRAGTAIISVKDRDKSEVLAIAADLQQLGFTLYATPGTAEFLACQGMTVQQVNKVQQGRPHLVDMIKNDQVHFMLNTTEGRDSIIDSAEIRRSALQHRVYYSTTLAGAKASILAMSELQDMRVRRLQTLYAQAQK